MICRSVLLLLPLPPLPNALRASLRVFSRELFTVRSIALLIEPSLLRRSELADGFDGLSGLAGCVTVVLRVVVVVVERVASGVVPELFTSCEAEG